ncbi:MFS transporter [Hyphomicrobium sp.]|uniref:MFS transporter n=1 Tax=Hyphomicrobium sp. TaxID=82 RepID=UPI002D78156C|nr:MFS transporter [Hyphomicrobium sp.]HET6389890.1 MFS transporter [Hyphomicrobium sp.]
MSSTVASQFTARERMLSLAAVCSTSFGIGISFGIGFPLTSLTFELWGQPSWMIGLAGAAPPLAILLALPIAPYLIDKLGSVQAIVVGCMVGALGFLALGLFEQPWAWLVIRVLMSGGFAIPWLAGETWINLIAREESRGRVIALYAVLFFSGYAVGPILLQGLGIVWPWPFLAAALVTALSVLPIVWGRRLAPPMAHSKTGGVAAAMRLSPVSMIGAFIGGFSEITILSLIPNVALAGGWSEQMALAMLTTTTVGGVLLQYPLGWLSDVVSRFAVMIGCVVSFILLTLALPFVLNNTFAGLATAFLIGGVILGFYAVGLAIIGERVTGADLTAANAAFIILYQCGGLIGPVFAGVAMTDHAVHGFVAVVVAIMVLSGAGMLYFNRVERRREQ